VDLPLQLYKRVLKLLARGATFTLRYQLAGRKVTNHLGLLKRRCRLLKYCRIWLAIASDHLI
jgi:hypothetical protein